ncbi:hypothetical protein ABTK48_20275, partial [Acinetobacter baumannii]
VVAGWHSKSAANPSLDRLLQSEESPHPTTQLDCMMENSNKKVVAAIDLGYGHTKFAKFDDSGTMTVDSFPSFVGVGASGK